MGFGDGAYRGAVDHHASEQSHRDRKRGSCRARFTAPFRILRSPWSVAPAQASRKGPILLLRDVAMGGLPPRTAPRAVDPVRLRTALDVRKHVDAHLHTSS